jgi:SagB-type dehydrogenase family enzyme
MRPIEMVLEYHDRTKHRPERYAASLGYMDWATQPDPFRQYEGAEMILLPMPTPSDEPVFAQLDQPRTPEALSIESLSRLLRFSLGLAAVKCMGQECWALRCNASSGNLHPTEGYVILPPIEGISVHSTVAHYAPKTHALELLHTFDTAVWETLPKGTFLFALTSVVWREAWKYGERAFRYTQLDAGHALHSVTTAGKLNGWHTRLLETIDPDTLDALLGLNQTTRFHKGEEEISDALLLVSPAADAVAPDLIALLAHCRAEYAGKANRLSPAHHPWEAITLVERATHTTSSLLPTARHTPPERTCSESAESIILKRRSARAMDFGRTCIERSEFLQLLHAAESAFSPFKNAASLVLFVHDVASLEPGLYLFVLNTDYLAILKEKMRSDFSFETVENSLYLLEKGDFRLQARFISCSQEIAADGAFSLGMLCEFAPQLEHHGPQRYKSLYWECGAIGQQLYLEATSLGLSATGIGCFLDDVMHRLLGLEGDAFQSLYHFTIGRAIPDIRLQTRLPYSDRQ